MESLPPKDLSHHLSRVTRNIQPSKVKGFYKYFRLPGISNLAAGFPNPNYFPYDTLEARAALPDRFQPTPTKPLDPPIASSSPSTSSPNAARVIVPHDDSEANLFRKIDLTSALQYGTAQGYPPLHTFVKDFTKKLHPNVPYAGGPDVILTCGNTDGFSKVLHAFNNAWDSERDWIRDREGLLVEEFAYMSPIQVAKPRGMNIAPIKMDEQGMMADGPGGLADVLSNWDKTKGRIPHLMYTVAMGQNPTSALMSLSRKKQIYTLCHKYDILIIEDEPYWYLQYPSALEISTKHQKREQRTHGPSDDLSGWKSTGSAFLDSLVPSYLSVDVDGRVIRLDTFSKTVAPGCRLGWITAQPAFVERIERMTETSTQQPSGFVQSLMAELLLGPSHASETSTKKVDKESVGWQVDGFVRWLEGLRGNYERRMQVMSQILEDGKYTSRQNKRRMSTASDDFELVNAVKMFDFEFPRAGMFLWLRCHYETHPLYEQVDHQRLSQALWVYLTTEPSRILVVPGTIFAGSDKILEEKAWQYFRLCFAAVEEGSLENISKRFILGMTCFWDIDDVKTIDDLLEDEDDAKMNERMGKLTVLS